MSFYCVSVFSGFEEKYEKELKLVLDKDDSVLKGNVYLFRKKMKLKNGKEYEDLFFPGYIFFETEETDKILLKSILSNQKGFIKLLPSNKNISPLDISDSGIIQNLLRFGSTIDYVPVTFNEGDRIVILGGPLKNIPATIVSVNRRNKRINVRLDFLNNVSIFGLTYQEIQKIDDKRE